MCLMDDKQGVSQNDAAESVIVTVINNEKIKHNQEPLEIQDNGIHGAEDNFFSGLPQRVLVNKVLNPSLSNIYRIKSCRHPKH